MEDNTGAERPTTAKRFLGLSFGIALVALVLDQASKLYVESNMELGESFPVIPGLLNIHYILNPGAAFSIGENFTIIFTLLQAAVVVYVSYLLIRKVRTLSWAITLGALLGGVAGNLVDRIFRDPGLGFGHVVDMIAVPRFAIFNVADSFIVCSMITVAILLIRNINLDGTKSVPAKRTGQDNDK
ncbi:signal peptidase II [Glutamicibacter sp. MNS18]|uniref:signal peptidase II n=1 Tax=Glutamicibacter sp. MNS18 TaxID=2989817 RepID=UPI002236022D|nr:signal peptidase II [Glutamicibacter sp. MNS18]MCW4464426.1 signal peptidase II [Glutamicibacter sp. MNS18]